MWLNIICKLKKNAQNNENQKYEAQNSCQINLTSALNIFLHCKIF